MNSIVLATRNRGKVKEILALLGDLSIPVKTLDDFPSVPEVEEDAETLEENALKKAREVFLFTGIPALADDSGLEVIALGMRPGVYSARYAGERATYEDNNRKLLAALEGVPVHERGARFRCVAAIVGPDFQETCEGTCSGVIATEFRGLGGFGYDPLFIPQGYDQSFAELPISVKNKMSHRALAFGRMKLLLQHHLRHMS